MYKEWLSAVSSDASESETAAAQEQLSKKHAHVGALAEEFKNVLNLQEPEDTPLETATEIEQCTNALKGVVPDNPKHNPRLPMPEADEGDNVEQRRTAFAISGITTDE
jgi:hypothetical protein